MSFREGGLADLHCKPLCRSRMGEDSRRARFPIDFVGTIFPIDPTFADLARHGAAFNLLGRADFFAHFNTVNFDQKNVRVEIR